MESGKIDPNDGHSISFTSGRIQIRLPVSLFNIVSMGALDTNKETEKKNGRRRRWRLVIPKLFSIWGNTYIVDHYHLCRCSPRFKEAAVHVISMREIHPTCNLKLPHFNQQQVLHQVSNNDNNNAKRRTIHPLINLIAKALPRVLYQNSLAAQPSYSFTVAMCVCQNTECPFVISIHKRPSYYINVFACPSAGIGFVIKSPSFLVFVTCTMFSLQGTDLHLDGP